MKEQIADYIEYASANIKASYIKSADRRILIKVQPTTILRLIYLYGR
jgi:hypothetical protein